MYLYHYFFSDEKRLDILVNNAGVMGVQRTLTDEGFELHLATNFLGMTDEILSA